MLHHQFFLSIVFYDSVIYSFSMDNDNYLNNLLGAFATTVASSIENEVAELGGRSLSHEAALIAIRNHSNDGIEMLSKVLDITHSGAVRLVNTLETEGFIERQRSDKDARAVVLRTTSTGRSRAKKVLQARERVTKRLLSSLSRSQKEAIVPVLEAVLTSVTKSIPGARRICRFCDEGVCRSIGCPVELAVKQKEFS